MDESGYNLTDYEYDLPSEFIAQEPFEPRDHCKLMALNRQTGDIKHHKFYDIFDYLQPDDILVVNETRVFPARLLGHKESGGQIEVFLLEQISENSWKALVRPARRFKTGYSAYFGNNEIIIKVIDEMEKGARIVETNPTGEAFYKVLERIGHVPLPPYIKRPDADSDRVNYQTVYSRTRGSVAAPTAGLHFTDELLERIKLKGVLIIPVTLHIGIDTFRPVDCEDIRDHKIHSEYYQISKENAAKINLGRKQRQRIIGVGTTSVRTLETAANPDGVLSELNGWSNLYIYPGYKYRIVDAIITNFHLPKSSLMMMISAFTSINHLKNAYDIAKTEHYRFFSYGDAMFLY